MGTCSLTSLVLSARKIFDDISETRVSKFCQLTSNSGGKTDIGCVEWTTFVPGEEGYVGVTDVNGVGSCFYEGVPRLLENKLSYNSKTVGYVSIAHDNS